MVSKAIVEATFAAINTLFCQHVASYTGPNPTRRGADVSGAWTLTELQDLLDEWLLALFTDRRIRFIPLTCCYAWHTCQRR